MDSNYAASRMGQVLTVLLTVPVISLIVGLLLPWASGQVVGGGVSAATLAALCGRTSTLTMPDACRAYHASGWITPGALWLGAASVLLVAALYAAGKIARASRTLLWMLFTPGLYITIASIFCLTIGNAVLGLAAVYFLGGFIAGGVLYPLVALAGVFAVCAMIAATSAAVVFIDPPAVHEVAQPLPPEQYPELWALVSELAAALHAKKPRRIIAGLDPCFYVTDAMVHTLSGLGWGRTLYLSLPMCRILERNELKAIIGHELGHFRNGDTAFNHRIHPIYMGACDALAHLHHGSRHIGGRFFVRPATTILEFFLDCFAEAERAFSREREFAADQVAVEAAGVRALAAALLKSKLYERTWGQVLQRRHEAGPAGTPVVNMSSEFVARAAETADHVDPYGAFNDVVDPQDTHPPLLARLEALHSNINGVIDDALSVPPADPASGLLANPELLEEELTAVLNELLDGGAVAVPWDILS